VPGKNDTLCLVVTTADEALSNCGAPHLLTNSTLYLEQSASGGMMHVWGIVGDDITSVSGAEVLNNTFAYSGPESQLLTISNGSADTRTIDLGQLHPPNIP